MTSDSIESADPMFDLVLRAPRAVVPSGDGSLVEQPAVVAVHDGVVRAVLSGSDALSDASDASAWTATSVRELNEDVVLLPGLVDTHVHVNEPGRAAWEGFESATRAAAAGGITTIVDMPLNSSPVTTTVDALEAKLAAAQGKMTTDVAFWGGAIPENLGSLRELWDAGVMGFKCFLLHSGIDEFPALNREQMLDAMREIAAFDGLLIVHAEDADTIDAAPEASGRAYESFLQSRPTEAEHRAIAQIIDGVRETGCRTHILHLSAASALPMIRAAKDEGLPLTVETCPHYLSLVAEAIQDGSTTHKCCPPIREAANREGLWRGLADGTIDVVVSDHSPCTPDLKRLDRGDFGDAWGGIASVQLGLPIVWTQARLRGIPVTRVVDWMALRTAQLVGLDTSSPDGGASGAARGIIAEGARADFAVLAPDEAFVVLPEHLHHKNAITAYAGEALAGCVRETYLAGELIATFDATSAAAHEASSAEQPAVVNTPRGVPVMRRGAGG